MPEQAVHATPRALEKFNPCPVAGHGMKNIFPWRFHRSAMRVAALENDLPAKLAIPLSSTH
jgi:hypothetical protein